MASKRRILRRRNDVSLIEENIYLLIPDFTIETTYIVTSRRRPDGAYFNSPENAAKAFEMEVTKSDSDHRGEPTSRLGIAPWQPQ